MFVQVRWVRVNGDGVSLLRIFVPLSGRSDMNLEDAVEELDGLLYDLETRLARYRRLMVEARQHLKEVSNCSDCQGRMRQGVTSVGPHYLLQDLRLLRDGLGLVPVGKDAG